LPVNHRTVAVNVGKRDDRQTPPISPCLREEGGPLLFGPAQSRKEEMGQLEKLRAGVMFFFFLENN
jgi:hypothetical protein